MEPVEANVDALKTDIGVVNTRVDQLVASAPQKEALFNPSTFGKQVLARLGAGKQEDFGGADGDAALSQAEAEELKGKKEVDVVRLLTEKLWTAAGAREEEIIDGRPVPSLRRVFVNSERHKWLDHLNESVDHENRDKPDGFFTWEPFVRLKPEAGRQGKGEHFLFGPLAHRQLQA